MKLVDMSCPHCGANLKIDSASKECSCEFCGAKLVIDDEVIHMKYDNAEESGYQFEKGRQRAQREAELTAKIQFEQQEQQPKKKSKTWLWVLGWICIFPVPLTVLMLRKKDMKPGVKYGIIAVAWIIYLLIGIFGSDGSETNTPTESTASIVAETTDSDENEIAESEDSEEAEVSFLDAFVEKFNENSDVPLEFVEEFTPSDNESEHYRTEFRLSAYSDALGKSYSYGKSTVDLIGRKSWSGEIIRIYMDDVKFEQCVNMLRTASPLMDPDIKEDEIEEAVEYITENKEANGYYFADLGLLLLGSDKNGYEFMLKPGND